MTMVASPIEARVGEEGDAHDGAEGHAAVLEAEASAGGRATADAEERAVVGEASTAANEHTTDVEERAGVEVAAVAEADAQADEVAAGVEGEVDAVGLDADATHDAALCLELVSNTWQAWT
jgi:hypothetical protein